MQTMLNVVKYQAEQAAKKGSTEAISASNMKKKVSESDEVLTRMYPQLAEEGSEIRASVDKTKEEYGIDSHPLGDYFATGIQVLKALPGLLADAEKRGNDSAKSGKVDDKRKDSIKKNLSKKNKGKKDDGSFSATQSETADQMNLSPSTRKIMQQLVGKNARTVSVKE